MNKDVTISYSQISAFLSCRYFWDLSYRRRIRRYTVKVPFEKGTAVHTGVAAAWRLLALDQREGKVRKSLLIYKRRACSSIEAWHRKWEREHSVGMNDQELEIMAGIVEEAREIAMMIITEINFGSWRILWYKNKPLIERELIIKVPGWKGFRTFPDLVAEDMDMGGNWVMDWKTRSQFLDISAEEVNLQFASMQHVLKRLRIETEGSIDFQVRSKPPSIPKRNKNGSMSRSRVATTWTIYKAALKDAGLKVSDYAEMEEKLDVPFTLLNRHYRSNDEIMRIWKGIILPAADEMRGDDVSTTRSMGYMNCNGCWARQFCLGELRGEDTEFMLKTSYVDKDRPRKRIKIDPGEVEAV